VQVDDWGSGAYNRGVVMSESFGWKQVDEMQVVASSLAVAVAYSLPVTGCHTCRPAAV
jgi:hypothetical protein